MVVNLNTVLTGLVATGIVLIFNNGVSINRQVIEMGAAQKLLAEKQDSLGKAQTDFAKKLEDVMPRAELETRFKSLETQVLEIKVRMQASELEIIKLRDIRH